MTDRFDGSLRTLLADEFGLQVTFADPVRGLGDECDIWRTREHGGLAIRVSPAFRTDLEWVHDLVGRFAAAVPESVSPLRTRDGRTTADWHGRPVSVWPWIDGAHLDRDDPAARTWAADLLARLHLAAEALPDLPRPNPPLRCTDCPHWPDLRDPALDAALAAWRRTRRRPVPLHGDFYRRNLICADGAIRGLIDWDELRIDHPERELAWTVWELCKHPDGDTLRPAAATAFLKTYEATTGRLVDWPFIIPLIREGLRTEICRHRTTGIDPEGAYAAAQVRAFHNLHALQSD
ncbi:phosphotransferase [Glycomyces sp. NPDC047369]